MDELDLWGGEERERVAGEREELWCVVGGAGERGAREDKGVSGCCSVLCGEEERGRKAWSVSILYYIRLSPIVTAHNTTTSSPPLSRLHPAPTPPPHLHPRTLWRVRELMNDWISRHV